MYGYLTTALGLDLGAVVGALVTASRQTVAPRAMLFSTVAFGIVNVLAMLSLSPSLLWAYSAIVLVGVANISLNTICRTLLMAHSDPTMHGRILALYGMAVLGSTPFGGLLLGWLCELGAPRVGLLLAGATALLVSATVTRRLLRPPEVAVNPLPASTPAP